MPINTDNAVLKQKIYEFRNYVRQGIKDKAAKLEKELIKTLDLGNQPNSVCSILFQLFKITDLSLNGKVEEASKSLSLLQLAVHNSKNTECLYYFYRNLGYIQFLQQNYNESKMSYGIALQILNEFDESDEISVTTEEKTSLYMSLAVSNSNLELPYEAILSLNDYALTQNNNNLETDIVYQYLLGLNYAKINNHDRANAALHKCLLAAESANDKIYVGRATFAFGFLNKQTKLYRNALEYFDKAESYFVKGSADYLANLYQKALCNILLRDYGKADEMIQYAYSIVEKNDNLFYPAFTALENIIVIYNSSKNNIKKSIDFLEFISIPYFISMSNNCEALDLCELLEQYYDEKKHSVGVVRMRAAALKVHKKLLAYEAFGGNV